MMGELKEDAPVLVGGSGGCLGREGGRVACSGAPLIPNIATSPCSPREQQQLDMQSSRYAAYCERCPKFLHVSPDTPTSFLFCLPLLFLSYLMLHVNPAGLGRINHLFRMIITYKSAPLCVVLTCRSRGLGRAVRVSPETDL